MCKLRLQTLHFLLIEVMSGKQLRSYFLETISIWLASCSLEIKPKRMTQKQLWHLSSMIQLIFSVPQNRDLMGDDLGDSFTGP